MAKRITQDLPPILGDIGVRIEPEPEEIVQEDAKAILSRFRQRPAKYAGLEVTIQCKVTGDVMAMDSDKCDAFNLPLGDAIQRQFESDVMGKYSYLIATRELADWLEEVPIGSDVTIRIKLLYGHTVDIEWTDDGTITKKQLVKGYQVTDILKSSGEANVQSDE